MAAFLINRRGNRRSGGRRAPISDVNITPMIDVMLVLLVIFMVTAPMLTVGVKVDLPKAHGHTIQGQDKPIVVFLNKEGRIFIGEVEVDRQTIGAKLKAITQESDVKIFVKGDQSLPYGAVMQLMGDICLAGFKKVVLVTELPKQGSKHK